MLTFFQVLVQADLPGLGFNGLLEMLVAPVNKSGTEINEPPLNKQVPFFFFFFNQFIMN